MIPASFTNPDDLEQKVDLYLKHCEATKQKLDLKNGDKKIRQELPTMIGLANWLGVSRDTLYSYMNRESKTGISDEYIERFSDTLSRARGRMEEALLNAALCGDVEPKAAGLVLYSYGYTAKDAENPVLTVRIATDKDQDVKAWTV